MVNRSDEIEDAIELWFIDMAYVFTASLIAIAIFSVIYRLS